MYRESEFVERSTGLIFLKNTPIGRKIPIIILINLWEKQGNESTTKEARIINILIIGSLLLCRNFYSNFKKCQNSLLKIRKYSFSWYYDGIIFVFSFKILNTGSVVPAHIISLRRWLFVVD